MALSQSSLAGIPAHPAAEEELVLLAKRGDLAAQEALARRFRRPAYLLALQLLGNPDDALDVAQDSLLRFFTKLHRFQSGRPVQPWLLTIVRNRARDLMRRHRVRRAEPLAGDDDQTYRPELVDPGAGPDTHAHLAELRRKVWTALGKLSEAQKEILVLRDYQDLAYHEIAEVLGIPIGTVMSRLHRARASLALLLAEDYGPDREASGSAPRGAETRRTPS